MRSKNIRQVGVVESFFSGVAKIKGFDNIKINEILIDGQSNPVAMVFGFDETLVEAIFFEENYDYRQPVFSSGKTMSVPVSKNYLGRVVNGIGIPIDNKNQVTGQLKSIFGSAPPTIDRKPIVRPMISGIKTIDATLPLGRGQRELIIGDRKLGKTTIALDTVLNQEDSNPSVYCVYVICGRKDNETDKIVGKLTESGALRYSVVVSAPSSSSLASQYLAPMVGTAIAEFFRDAGGDALIVYDDLGSHAKVARSISLLLGRSPGREVYPGNIFSIHAALLERSAQLSDDKGGGSLTALPIVETQEGDLASYIPTNLISITDGQIYLDRELFDKNFLPAINIGLSVSRIGAQAQPPILREATKALRLSIAQNSELERLSQLETNLSKESQNRLKRGKLILNLLKQQKGTNVTWEEQTILFYSVSLGKFDNFSEKELSDIEHNFLQFLHSKDKYLLSRISQNKEGKNISKDISDAADSFLKASGKGAAEK